MTKDIWAVKLDWLNIVMMLDLDSIDQIPEDKREKAIRKVSKIGLDDLLSMDPKHLDTLVAEELVDLMKKELTMHKRGRERIEKKIRENFMPMKQGGIIRINSKDLKDLDPDAKPEDILKHLYKKFTGKSKEEDDDDKDQDKCKEDKTGYYI